MRTMAFAATLIATALLSVLPVFADNLVIGGDVYSGGSPSSQVRESSRDAFAYGFSVNLAGDVGKDAHAAGFDVEADGKIGADLYLAGGSVTIRSIVAEDLSASGFTVRLDEQASVGGNARIVGGMVNINAPVSGSLLAAGGKIVLNGAIAGDVRLTAGEIEFGPAARIGGRLTYAASAAVDVPPSVLPADRITRVPSKEVDIYRDLKEVVEEAVPSFWPSFLGVLLTFVVTMGFFLLVAAVCLAFAPKMTEQLRLRANESPGISLLSGFLGLSLLAGLVPASALTIIGLPLVPIALMAILVLWLLGYLLGVYAFSIRVWTAFSGSPRFSATPASKLLALAIGLVMFAVLNFIPVAGWLANLAVMFFGLGAITLSSFTHAMGIADENLPMET